jgi:hypothetical protein
MSSMIKGEFVSVHPNFDSGTYKNSFSIYGSKINEFNLTSDDFDNLSLGITALVDAFLRMKEGKGQ